MNVVTITAVSRNGRTHICSHFSSKPAIVPQIASSTASMLKVTEYMLGVWTTIAMEKTMVAGQRSVGLHPIDLPGGEWQQNKWGTWQHIEAAEGESAGSDDDTKKRWKKGDWGTWGTARSSLDNEGDEGRAVFDPSSLSVERVNSNTRHELQQGNNQEGGQRKQEQEGCEKEEEAAEPRFVAPPCVARQDLTKDETLQNIAEILEQYKQAANNRREAAASRGKEEQTGEEKHKDE